jgi:hypothetical protein
VSPEAVVSTVPTPATVVVDTLTALAEWLAATDAPEALTIPTVNPVSTTAEANPSTNRRCRRTHLGLTFPARCELPV